MYWLEIQDLVFLIKCIKYPLTILTLYSLVYLSSPHAREHQAPRSLSTISVGAHQPSTFILTGLFISGMPFHQLTPPNPSFYQKADNKLPVGPLYSKL